MKMESLKEQKGKKRLPPGKGIREEFDRKL